MECRTDLPGYHNDESLNPPVIEVIPSRQDYVEWAYEFIDADNVFDFLAECCPQDLVKLVRGHVLDDWEDIRNSNADIAPYVRAEARK